MGQGHILDANTIGLWRMDENFAHITGSDVGSGIDPVTLAAPGDWPYITDYHPVPGYYCRFFGASKDGANVYRHLGFDWTGSTTRLARYKADLTVELFMRVDAHIDSLDMPIHAYGTVNTLQANNIPFSWYINASGKMKVVWESGVNVQHVTTAVNHANLIDATWHHLAVTVQRSNKTVKFYVDGVNTDTLTYTTEPTDGSTTAQVSLFGMDTDGSSSVSYPMFGRAYAKSVRISNIVRTPSEIATNAARLTTTSHHDVDANTVHYWNLSATPCFLDHSGRGRHASRLSTAGSGILSLQVDGPHPEGGIIGDGGRATYNEEMCYRVGYDSVYQQALVNEHTLEMWVILTPYATSPPTLSFGLFAHGGMDTGEGEIQAHNHYHYCLTSALQLQVNWETGSGTEQTRTTTTAVIKYGVTYHLAFRKRDVGGGNAQIDFFVNGVLLETTTSITNYPSGAGTTFVYATRLLSANNGQGWTGFADDIRFSDIARTNAEILESYELGATSATGGDPPEVLNVTPTAGTPLAPDSTVGFDVIDDTGLTRVIIVARFPNRGIWEVIHDGDAFAPAYATGSTRTAITVPEDGFHYDITRVGGWPDTTLEIEPFVIDDGGQENV